MAKLTVSNLLYPTYVISSKNGCERKVYFTDCLKNSSTMKEWIEHEKRVSDLILILWNLDAEFQNLHAQDPTVWIDVGKFFLTYSSSKDKLCKEFGLYLSCWKTSFKAVVWGSWINWSTNLKQVLRIGANHSKFSGAWLRIPKVWKWLFEVFQTLRSVLRCQMRHYRRKNYNRYHKWVSKVDAIFSNLMPWPFYQTIARSSKHRQRTEP